jgi:hypothetical protein
VADAVAAVLAEADADHQLARELHHARRLSLEASVNAVAMSYGPGSTNSKQ